MGLEIKQQLQPMFDTSQKNITLLEQPTFLQRQTTGLGQLGDGGQRVFGSDGSQFTTVEQLQKLNGEFNVANPASTFLDISFIASCLGRSVFDLPLECANFSDLRVGETFMVDPGLQFFEKSLPQTQ